MGVSDSMIANNPPSTTHPNPEIFVPVDKDLSTREQLLVSNLIEATFSQPKRVQDIEDLKFDKALLDVTEYQQAHPEVNLIDKFATRRGVFLRINALYVAATSAYVYRVKQLLKAGANPTLLYNSEEPDSTLLHIMVHPFERNAQQQHASQIVELLVEHKADINTQSANGNTPLHIACSYNEPAVIRQLLRRGAKPDTANRAGLTPLMIASQIGHLSAVKQLLKAGAKVSLIDREHNDALYHALKRKQINVSTILVAAYFDQAQRLSYSQVQAILALETPEAKTILEIHRKLNTLIFTDTVLQRVKKLLDVVLEEPLDTLKRLAEDPDVVKLADTMPQFEIKATPIVSGPNAALAEAKGEAKTTLTEAKPDEDHPAARAAIVLSNTSLAAAKTVTIDSRPATILAPPAAAKTKPKPSKP